MRDRPKSPLSVDREGIRLTVRVTPRAKFSAFAGIVAIGEDRSALAVRLAAPPVDGAANTALCGFLAGQLGIPKSRVEIASGQTSRIKTIALAGDPASLEARMRDLLALVENPVHHPPVGTA
jgi:uncharacterized protein (TIGR00251 family)